MRVPGFRARNSGCSRTFMAGSRYMAITVPLEVCLEQVLLEELDAVAHPRGNGVRARFGNPLRIQFDADAAGGAEILHGGDWDAPVARTEIEDDVTVSNLRGRQHPSHDFGGRRDVDDVERLGGLELDAGAECEPGWHDGRQRQKRAEHRAHRFPTTHIAPLNGTEELFRGIIR